MKASSPQQLDINFDTDSRLKNALHDGHFIYSLELNPPAGDLPLPDAISQMQEFIKAADAQPEVDGFTVTDHLHQEDAHDPVSYAEMLQRLTDKILVITLSGKGSSLARLRELAAVARGKRLPNILAVTGDLSRQHVITEPHPPFPPYPPGYCDSVELLQALSRINPDGCLGATVNCYKYTPEDQCLQYAKMMRKINCGASFLISQIGWDMKKAQELQWYLQMREQNTPVLARIALFPREQALHLDERQLPGIQLPLHLGGLISRRAKEGAAPYYDDQIDRISMQVVGYNYLGFSGVQFCGIQSAAILQQLFGRIQERLQELNSYNAWLEKWTKLYNDLNLAPILTTHYGGSPHYLYRDLMMPDKPMYMAETALTSGSSIAPPTPADRLKLALAAKEPASFLPKLLQKTLKQATKTAQAHGDCFGLDNDACPKHLHLGPCGGSRPDGCCEAGEFPCFFHRVAQLANATNAIQLLEDAPQQEVSK